MLRLTRRTGSWESQEISGTGSRIGLLHQSDLQENKWIKEKKPKMNTNFIFENKVSFISTRLLYYLYIIILASFLRWPVDLLIIFGAKTYACADEIRMSTLYFYVFLFHLLSFGFPFSTEQNSWEHIWQPQRNGEMSVTVWCSKS